MLMLSGHHFTTTHASLGRILVYNKLLLSQVSGPSEDDARAAYILFYQKPATLPTIDRSEDDFDDSIERVSMETILKRFQTPCPQLPPPPLRKHNSNRKTPPDIY